MVKKIFEIVAAILSYICNIRAIEIPMLIAYLGVIAGVGYGAALFLVGFPCSLWEAITKKKIDHDSENKIIFRVAICLDIVMWICFLYGMAT